MRGLGYLARALVAVAAAVVVTGCAAHSTQSGQPQGSTGQPSSSAEPSSTSAVGSTGPSGATGGPSAAPSSGSVTLAVVTGLVDASPGCPGPVRLGTPCPARPVPGAVVVVIRDGHAVTSVVTDRAGRFKLRLAPGTYQFTARSAVGFRSQASRTVTVPTSHLVELTIDSGMR